MSIGWCGVLIVLFRAATAAQQCGRALDDVDAGQLNDRPGLEMELVNLPIAGPVRLEQQPSAIAREPGVSILGIRRREEPMIRAIEVGDMKIIGFRIALVALPHGLRTAGRQGRATMQRGCRRRRT